MNSINSEKVKSLKYRKYIIIKNIGEIVFIQKTWWNSKIWFHPLKDFSPKELLHVDEIKIRIFWLSQRGVRKFLSYFSIVNCNSDSTRSGSVIVFSLCV